MKKIIVPVDFSEYSENALKTAAHIAKRQNAEIVAVHMLELSDGYMTSTEGQIKQEAIFYLKMAEQRFNDFLDVDFLDDLKVVPLVRPYKIFSELNEVAKEEGADLIIMGSHGTSGLKELFVGSNTERVVRNSEIPVLVVKGIPVTSDFSTAIFACDFVGDDDAIPYNKAKALLDKLGCKLQLVHINTPYANFLSTRERRERVAKFLQEVDGNLDRMDEVAFVSDYTVEEGIFEYANLSGSDLIVMATHGRRGLNHFFNGSISEDVTNHSTLPVITFKI